MSCHHNSRVQYFVACESLACAYTCNINYQCAPLIFPLIVIVQGLDPRSAAKSSIPMPPEEDESISLTISANCMQQQHDVVSDVWGGMGDGGDEDSKGRGKGVIDV